MEFWDGILRWNFEMKFGVCDVIETHNIWINLISGVA